MLLVEGVVVVESCFIKTVVNIAVFLLHGDFGIRIDCVGIGRSCAGYIVVEIELYRFLEIGGCCTIVVKGSFDIG